MPTDGNAFREIEETWSYFKDEPCHLRISLVVDGVNPFKELRYLLRVAYFCYQQ